MSSREEAEAIIDKGLDLVYVGRSFISNPDLVSKFKQDQDLKAPNADLFYSPGAEGYTDY